MQSFFKKGEQAAWAGEGVQWLKGLQACWPTVDFPASIQGPQQWEVDLGETQSSQAS